MTKSISLSQEYVPGMHVYPGEKHLYQIQQEETESFITSHISLGIHVGTHMDMPMHVKTNRRDVASPSADEFCGKAQVKQVKIDKDKNIIPFKLFDIKSDIDFLLFHTGWSKYWGESLYFEKWPAFSPDWIPWLAEQKLKGIGVDTPSLDGLKSFPFHDILLAKMFFYENLTNVEKVPEICTFYGLPLRLRGAEAGPVHAFAVVK